MNSNPILCSNLNELVKKIVLTFCEVNVKFSHHLDIYGSIHIRADDNDVASMLLNEHCIKNSNGPQTDSGISVQVSDNHGSPSTKESYKSTSTVASEPHFTKVIQSDGGCSTSGNSNVGGQQMPMGPSPSQILQQRCPLPPLPPNMFTNPMFLDVCNNGMGVPVSDPFRYMGFMQTPMNITADLRDTPLPDNSMTSDLKGNQDNFLPQTTQDNFMQVSDLKNNHASQDGFMVTSEPKGSQSTQSNYIPSNSGQQTPTDQGHLPDEDMESNTEDNRQELSATESSIPQPPTDYESDITVSHPGVSPWQQDISDTHQIDDNNAVAPLTTSTPVSESDSDSAQDTSSSQGGVTYRCRICRKTYSDMKVYSHHVSVCKYQCPRCTKTFSAKQTLDTHMQEEHSQGQSTASSVNNNNNNNNVGGRSRYQCNVCDQHFKSRAALNGHMTFRHRKQQQKGLYC